MNSLLFYPKLTEQLKNTCGINVGKYKFSYSFQDQVYGLLQKGSSTIKLSDPLDIWKVESEGLNFSKVINIAYPNFLYGENGIACEEAEIGICITWTNKTLSQTGCIMPVTDVMLPTGRTCGFDYAFDPGTIKGDLELSVNLYIKKSADNVKTGEEKLINEEGVTIGEIESVVLDFNSIYMEFPIEELYSPDEPLWWVYLSQWDDPKVDLFNEENVCLYLNPYYSACPMVGEEIKNLDLLIDILATTYLLIFQKIGENPEDLKATQHNLGLETNSICSIMFQFIDDCPKPLHFESPEALHKSLSVNIRERLKDGDE